MYENSSTVYKSHYLHLSRVRARHAVHLSDFKSTYQEFISTKIYILALMVDLTANLSPRMLTDAADTALTELTDAASF